MSVTVNSKCEICNKHLSSPSALKKHMLRHKSKDELPFKCMFCPYKSAAKRDLLRHHDQHVGHSRQVYKCDLCNKAFKLSSSLTEHVNTIHEKKIFYKCELCDYSTARRSSLRIHSEVHSVSKIKFICPICGSFLKNKYSLKSHLLTHADTKQFNCLICNKNFTMRNRLLAHIQVTHSPKMFDCTQCCKSFATASLLRRHHLTHTGERPFTCCFCPSTSNTRGNLVKHVRNVHHMTNFTFKDIQRKNGVLNDIDSTNEPSEHEPLFQLKNEGKKISQEYLNKLKEKGLTSSSIEHLIQDSELRRKSEDDIHPEPILKAFKKGSKSRSSEVVSSYIGNVEESVRKPSGSNRRQRRNKSEKQNLGISECHNILIQPTESFGSNEEMDVFSSNAPAIQVIWNVNQIENNSFRKLPAVKSGKKRTKKRKNKEIKYKTKTDSGSNRIVPPHVNISTNLNSASNVPDESELTLPCRSLINGDQEHPSSHIPSEFVNLDELDSGSTVVISSDPMNSDMDSLYKNIDYSHFLSIADGEPVPFIHSFESTVSARQANSNDMSHTVNDYLNTNSNKSTMDVSTITDKSYNFAPMSSVDNLKLSSKLNNLRSANLQSGNTNEDFIALSSDKIAKIVTRKKCRLKVIPGSKNDFNVPSSDFKPQRNCNITHGIRGSNPKYLVPRQSSLPKQREKLVNRGDMCLTPTGDSDELGLHLIKDTKEIIIKSGKLCSSVPSDEVSITSVAEIKDEVEDDLTLWIPSLR